MEGIASLVQLQHLELYDNQIQKISSLDALVNLRVLDLSFNEIRVIPDLSHLTKLEELYVANNKLKRISGISSLRTLKKLDLGANRLREIQGLDGLEQLEQLWLGKNKIEKIQGLEALTKLRIISVQVCAWLRCFTCNENASTNFMTSTVSCETECVEQPLGEDGRLGAHRGAGRAVPESQWHRAARELCAPCTNPSPDTESIWL